MVLICVGKRRHTCKWKDTEVTCGGTSGRLPERGFLPASREGVRGVKEWARRFAWKFCYWTTCHPCFSSHSPPSETWSLCHWCCSLVSALFFLCVALPPKRVDLGGTFSDWVWVGSPVPLSDLPLVVSYHELCWVREQMLAGGRKSCEELAGEQGWAVVRWRCPWPACAGKPPPSCGWQTSCKLWPLSPGSSPGPGPEMGKHLSEYTPLCWGKAQEEPRWAGLRETEWVHSPKAAVVWHTVEGSCQVQQDMGHYWSFGNSQCCTGISFQCGWCQWW